MLLTVVDYGVGNLKSIAKSIEKAKGLLMNHKKVTEDEAYQSIRKMAMDKNKRISEVADGIISAFEILD